MFTFFEYLFAARQGVVGRVTLQPPDLDRFLKQSLFDARTLAKDLDRADPCTRRADRIRVEYHPGGAVEIAARDLFNERRYVDVRRARVHARRVVTVEASVRLVKCLGRCECRVDVGKVLLDLSYIER
jgi:hypothetical protein